MGMHLPIWHVSLTMRDRNLCRKPSCLSGSEPGLARTTMVTETSLELHMSLSHAVRSGICCGRTVRAQGSSAYLDHLLSQS